MTIIDHPFISENIDNPRRVLRRLRWGRLVTGVFILKTAEKPDELEIIRSEFFRQKSMREDERPIVGFFKSYDEAVGYVVDITQKSYDKYGYPSLCRYIKEESEE